ncbi:hypothetical protein FRZ03_02315 [Streptomyces misionensis]|uniref:Uncharacterized protein n=1 Tax=Streptomyces misionensis TaxID=67331 RepID=A0A5C6K544_9ACTN|nr:hypothetical protein [Streptomyces misionensis]TWV57444.1 hypothetical protein FRZ03_02315 [Streptomyces misionensis]
MRETPDTERKRFDLNVPQVAGSALAAVVAAKLASSFGVYGTILGAGVVSVIATCGGTVFQHFFKRTGEQLRVVKTGARPQVQVPPVPGEFSEGTVYRARIKSWRRPLVAAALVFGVTMGGITVYELVSGSSFSGGTGTTVGDAVGGRHSSAHRTNDPQPGQDPSWTPSHTAPTGGVPSQGAGTGTGGGTTDPATPTPSASPDGRTGGGQAGPTPTPSGSAPAATPPAPSADSRSGTADPGQGGPATP